MGKILKSLLILAVTASVIGLVGTKNSHAITAKDSVCQGIGVGGGSTDCSDTAGSPNVTSSITTAIDIFSWIAGIAAVIVVIVGGFKYITSAGDSNGVSSAKNTIMYALIGLIVVAFAQVIVKFVVKKFTT